MPITRNKSNHDVSVTTLGNENNTAISLGKLFMATAGVVSIATLAIAGTSKALDYIDGKMEKRADAKREKKTANELALATAKETAKQKIIAEHKDAAKQNTQH